MSGNKTVPVDHSVDAFINSVEDEKKQADSRAILALMQEMTGEKPIMWGGSIVGFGKYRYKYASGREGEWFLTGFSPRKQALTLYITAGFTHYEDLLSKLGKYKTGVSCLYIRKLEDVDRAVLRELVKQSVAHMIATNE